MKKVTLYNHGQGSERNFGYGKSWHIPNYQFIQVIQKSISFAWFSKDLDFSWTSKCDYIKPGFISKSDYLKYQCFGSTDSENGKIFI